MNKNIDAAGLSRRQALVSAMAASAALAVGLGRADAAKAQTAATSYGTEDFFRHNGSKGVAMSPSGNRLAVLHQQGVGEATVSSVTIHASDTPSVVRMRLPIGSLGVNWVYWSGDEQLLVSVYTPAKDVKYRPAGTNRVETLEGYENHRVISLNVATGDQAVMFQHDRDRLRYSPNLGRVTSFLPDEPEYILMPAYQSDGALDLFKVNTTTGRAEVIEEGNALTVGWHIHDGVPVLRRDINSRFTVETWYARLPNEKDWRVMRRSRVRDAPDLSYIGQASTPEHVRVKVWVDNEDALAVRDISLRDYTVSEPILPKAGYDAVGGLYDSRDNWLGTSYYGERLEYVFEDADLKAHHQALEAFYENDCDVIIQDINADHSRMIAYVAGPREPGLWVFYDRNTRQITPMGARTNLDYERLSEGRRIVVDTRDGAKVEAYLTLPLSGRAGPVVVLPHGGPELRDYRHYNRQAQIFAAQGWWVLQPNFRGSGGYGQAFAKAGWGRWGTRMQEDVEDVLDKVIADFNLDKDRVAIVGTSYGGYAALMGAVRRPEFYKATIAICGVSDLVELLQWEKRTDDTPGKLIFDFWTKRIGDLEVDRAAIEAGSPRLRVSEIQCPVLLVHGKDDRIVPVQQSTIMQRALNAAGKSVEYIEVEGGHADWDDDQEQKLMIKYVDLLKKAFA